MICFRRSERCLVSDMEDILTFCGVGILSVFAICVMREVRAELTVPTVLAVTVMFMCVLITRITSAVEFSSKYGAYIRTEYITYILRALGISYITSFSCEICRTLGQDRTFPYRSCPFCR